MESSIKYKKSFAFKGQLKNGSYEMVNVISGKSFRISAYLHDLLEFCSDWRQRETLVERMLKDSLDKTQVELTLQNLVNSKMIVSKLSDVFCELVPQHPTFFGIKSGCLYSKQHQISLIGIPFGGGNDVDARCKDAPRTLRKATSSFFPLGIKHKKVNSSFFHQSFLRDIFYNNMEKMYDVGDVFYATGDSCVSYYDRITNVISRVVEMGNVPFCIGGDHSITYPILKGISTNNPSFLVLHFDAHSDLSDSDYLQVYQSSESEMLNHATVMSFCAGLDKVKEIIQIGVREPFFVENPKCKQISLSEMRSENAACQCLMERKDYVYLSFDVDFFDPSIAPGTASKIIDGGFYEETFAFLSKILKNKKILGIDIVETNLYLDSSYMTTQLVMKLMLHLLGLIKL